MATYMDTPYQGGEYISSVPLDLIMRVGIHKQEKYDKNKAALQENLDKFSQYPIIKPEDREVIGTKLKELTESINTYSGRDLSDSNVFSEINSLADNLYNDPDVLNRISSNKKYVENVEIINEIKRKHPEQYSYTNEKVFKDQANKWLLDPKETSFDASYIPYYDGSKWQSDVLEFTLKNPEITREIEYYTDSAGNRIKRGEREVKQVKMNKIQDNMLASMPEPVKRQWQIDYLAGTDQYSLEDTLGEINAKYTDYKKKSQELSIQASNLTGDLKDQAEAKSKRFEDLSNYFEDQYKTVAGSKDPTLYHTFDKYVKDKTFDIAQSNTNRQEGELKDDFMFTKDYEHQLKMEEDEFKSKLDIDKMRIEAAEGIGRGSNIKNKNGELKIANSFMINTQELYVKGQTSYDSKQQAALFNQSSKVQDDGSYSLTLSDTPVFLDIQPVLGIDTQGNMSKSAGYSKAQSVYESWKKTPEGTKTEMLRGGNLKSDAAVPVKVPKTYAEFLASKQGKELTSAINSEFGINITDQEAIKALEQFNSDPDTQQALSILSTAMSAGKIAGRLNVVPGDGINTVIGNDSNPYTKVLTQFTQQDMERIFGDDGWFQTKGYAKLIERGLAKEVQSAKDGSPIYQIGMMIPVSKDLTTANINYLENNGSKFYSDHLPDYAEVWDTEMTGMSSISRYAKVSPKDLSTKAYDNITKNILPNLPEAQREAEEEALKQEVRKMESILNSNPDTKTRIKALRMMEALIEQDPTTMIQPKADLSNKEELISKAYTRSQFFGMINSFKKGISANEGTYEEVNPQTGAMGKYQFLSSTLRGEVYDEFPEYKEEYNSYADFKEAFMKSPSLQEDAMNKFTLAQAEKYDYNPYKTALGHFLGEGGVNSLASGSKEWTSNPTQNVKDKSGKTIKNTTPLNYLRIFVSKFNS